MPRGFRGTVFPEIRMTGARVLSRGSVDYYADSLGNQKIHESHLQPILFDDFWGNAMDARWGQTLTGGTILMTGPESGGWVRFSTGAVLGNDVRIFSGEMAARNFFNPVCEMRIEHTPGVTMNMAFGLVESDYDPVASPAGTNDCALFNNLSADANYFAVTADNVAMSRVDTGIAKFLGAHIFRIEMRSGDVLFYIDDSLVVTKTTNLPVGTTALRAYVGLDTPAASNRQLWIDYISVSQRRIFP